MENIVLLIWNLLAGDEFMGSAFQWDIYELCNHINLNIVFKCKSNNVSNTIYSCVKFLNSTKSDFEFFGDLYFLLPRRQFRL